MYTLVPDVKYGINVHIGVPSRLSHQAEHLVQVEIIGPVHIKPQQPFIQYWIHISKLDLFCCQPPASAHFRILRELRLRCISLVVVHIHHHFSRCTSAAAGPHPSAQERPPFQSSFLFKELTCRDFSADCQPSSFLIQGRQPPHLWRLRCRKPFFFNCCPWASCLGAPSCHFIHGKSIQQSGRKSVCPF